MKTKSSVRKRTFFEKWKYSIWAETERGRWYGCWRDLTDKRTEKDDHLVASAEEAIQAATYKAAVSCGLTHMQKKDKNWDKVMKILNGTVSESED